MHAVTSIDLASSGLEKIASGKVREIFQLDSDTLLFVATDRISANDVVLNNGIPNKGVLLTQMSAYWFDLIKLRLPTLKTHLVSTAVPESVPSDLRPLLSKRSMQVRRLPIVPIESIVRGYITGSAWSEYKVHGTVHGMAMPPGLQESQKLNNPIWTPSTKAEQGQHDENISRTRAAEVVGQDVADRIETASLALYAIARDVAAAKGIIIADTKFEFGIDPDTKEIVLVDEVLTPDSSRFWPQEDFEVGRAQTSFDKQYLRDWLKSTGLKGKEDVAMPPEVVERTAAKYREAFEKLTGSI